MFVNNSNKGNYEKFMLFTMFKKKKVLEPAQVNAYTVYSGINSIRNVIGAAVEQA